MANQPDSPIPRRSWRAILEVFTSVAILVACGVVVWANLSSRRVATPGPTRPTPPIPTEPISIEGAHVLGSSLAKVVLIEYSDFQCPYCGSFARQTLPTLEKEYVASGKIRVAFYNLPLPNHQYAQKAGESAECAGRQGKFWEMHNRLFDDQKQLDATSLLDRARSLGLNENKFSACLNGEVAKKVEQDAASAKALAISGTPAFLIGSVQPDGRVKISSRLPGAMPIAQFREALDKQLRSSVGPKGE